MVQRAIAHGQKRSLNVLAVSITLAFALVFAAPSAFADPVAEKQAEAQAALQSLNTMLADIDRANADYAAAIGAQEQAKNLMKQTQARMVIQNEKIEECQRQLGSRIRSMYRTGTATFLDVFFGSTTFLSFATNWDLLSNMNKDDALLVQQTKVERSKLASLEEEYSQQQAVAAASAAEAEQIRDQANETAKRMQATYDSLSAEAAELIAEQQAAQIAEAAAAAVGQEMSEEQREALAAAISAQGIDAQFSAQTANMAVFNNGAVYAEDAGQSVALTDITSFDAGTGTATLADGSTATVVGYDINTGNAIVDLAASFVGGNYSWGAEDPTTSTFDCSGLVQYVYAQNGITVGGHNDRAILNAGTVVSESEAQVGDILWWDGHVAIYAGDNMMISADNEEMGITYRQISDGATYVRY